MKVLFFGNNALAVRVLEHLHAAGDEVVGLVLHPQERRGSGPALIEAARVPPDRVFDGSRLQEPAVRDAVTGLGGEIGVSVLFGYILRPAILEGLSRGCVNLHPGYLPYNRGAYPNVWSIVEGTPAGATLHFVDEGIDTGDIVAQKRVAVAEEDTGASLYRKLEEACFEVFREAWPAMREGRAPRMAQQGPGTFHRVADVSRIDEIDPDRSYPAGKLLDILRARTFPPHRGAFLRRGAERIYLSLELEADR